MNKWLELAAKCEAATGPDREMDACLAEAIGWHIDRTSNLHWMSEDELPSYTASLDAITALIERELPGEVVGSNTDRAAQAIGYIGCFAAAGKTEALARCAAFCRAMAAKSPEENPEQASADCK